MKKTFVFALVACSFLVACSTMDKDADVSSSTDRMNAWGEADITNLEDTKLSTRFKKAVSPIIYFDFNAAYLNGAAMDILNEQIAWLQNNPMAMIVVEGHCDERGTREYNLALGEKRANAVKDYMMANGIDSGRIRTISYGKERPDVFGSTEDAWSKNRRSVTIAN